MIRATSEGCAPPLIDLPSLAKDLRAIGLPWQLRGDSLWVGKVGLNEHGEISVDGRVRGLSSVQLGEGVDGFMEVLRRRGLVGPTTPGPSAKWPGAPWRAGRGPPSPRLQGRRAKEAIQRFHTFLDERGLQAEQIGPARFLVEPEIYYNVPSGAARQALSAGDRITTRPGPPRSPAAASSRPPNAKRRASRPKVIGRSQQAPGRPSKMTSPSHSPQMLSAPSALQNDGLEHPETGSQAGAAGTTIDLAKLARELQSEGWRSRLSDDGLCVRKACLKEWGEISLDGRVRGLHPNQLGVGVEAFRAVLPRLYAVEDKRRSSKPRPEAKKRAQSGGSSWRRPPRLQGPRGKQATERFLLLLAACGLRAEQLKAATFLIARDVQYNTHSGRILVKGERTFSVQGLVALAYVLSQRARDPKTSHLYPPSLLTLTVNSPAVLAALEDPLERRWATSIAAKAMLVTSPKAE